MEFINPIPRLRRAEDELKHYYCKICKSNTGITTDFFFKEFSFFGLKFNKLNITQLEYSNKTNVFILRKHLTHKTANIVWYDCSIGIVKKLDLELPFKQEINLKWFKEKVETLLLLS